MSKCKPVIEVTEAGLYCPAGDFFIDPVRKVNRAIITHAHSDHARPGSKAYLCANPGGPILEARVGAQVPIETVAYGEKRRMGGALVSLHPAGHILGSAQVRVEVDGEIWVVSGDYNNHGCDPSCAPFESIACDVFITESTFALPVYRWPPAGAVFEAIHRWWERNRQEGVTSVLPAYPLGKSQRILAGLDPGAGPIAVDGNVARFVSLYRAAGIHLPPVVSLTDRSAKEVAGRGLIITSSGARVSPVLSNLGRLSWGAASGWLQTRAARQGRGVGGRFVLSDHADWTGLLAAIRATGAQRIGVMHGETEVFARYLCEIGFDAFALPRRFGRGVAAPPPAPG